MYIIILSYNIVAHFSYMMLISVKIKVFRQICKEITHYEEEELKLLFLFFVHGT